MGVGMDSISKSTQNDIKRKGLVHLSVYTILQQNQQSNSNLQVDKGFSNEYIDQLIIIIIVIIIHQLYLMK